MSTPTPRTDAMIRSHEINGYGTLSSFAEDFARELERELAAARAEVEKAKHEAELHAANTRDHQEWVAHFKERAERAEAEVAALKSEYAELQSSRDRAMQLNREQAAEVERLRKAETTKDAPPRTDIAALQTERTELRKGNTP